MLADFMKKTEDSIKALCRALMELHEENKVLNATCHEAVFRVQQLEAQLKAPAKPAEVS